jgi:hypothetical protein
MIICQVAEAVLSLDESDYRMSGRSRLLPRVSKFQSFQRVSQLDYMLHFFYPPHGHQAGGP